MAPSVFASHSKSLLSLPIYETLSPPPPPGLPRLSLSPPLFIYNQLTMTLLDKTQGAVFIGVIVAAMLYGVSCAQVWYFYIRYPNDSGLVKILVGLVWIFDTAHQALISHTVYTYLIVNYGNGNTLDRIVWSIIVEVLFNGLTALLVQSFFMLRIFKLSDKNIWLIAPVFFLVLGEFASVIGTSDAVALYVAQALPLQTFDQLDELKALSMVVNGLAAAGDVLIAAILCTMLHRSRTGFKSSDSLINRLIIFSVNTGLLTSICAVLSLVTIAALPNTFIYICFYFTLGRRESLPSAPKKFLINPSTNAKTIACWTVYSNSLLATLNARAALRDKSSVDMSLSLRDLQRSESGRVSSMPYGIETTKELTRDGDIVYDSPHKAEV
ncbi:hypothetical protein A0H81_08279 [Grifola frondosa]|uniref:DUF6534 domain-containing protein n=1 Tax=Grifola frondosa TaxID=5627 RepID=A0A1C7M4C4_GRIFR|nr:hypothetical protein A0H81_08279 [Grifola frondosa]